MRSAFLHSISEEKMIYIAHTRKNSNEIQTLKEHLLNSKTYAEKNGEELAIPHVTGLAGLIHDLGKYRQDFQKYIKDPTTAKKGSIDHASFGAIFIKNKVKQITENSKDISAEILGEIVSNAICSHHNSLGLKDYLNARLNSPYSERMDKFNDDPDKMQELKQAVKLFYDEVMHEEEFDQYLKLALQEFKRLFDQLQSKDDLLDNIYYVGQFVYSCLLDADRTDTALFSFNQTAVEYQYEQIFESYYDKLLNNIKQFDQSSAINQARSEMSTECDAFAEQADGIYRLSIPTGGGKTLASLRYGLKHAAKTKKKHIIYVLPYITIIEQNAQVIRKMLNGDAKNMTNILEFHSNVSNDLKDDDIETEKTIRLAEDNWDSPIVITTMVQFLNSVYARSTVNRRRFHNLCDSVIIFDEVQKLPLKSISMFNKLLNFLSDIGQSDIVLCTATQPAFDSLTSGTSLRIANKPEMISNLSKRIQQFKRVKIIDRTRKNGADCHLSANEAAEMIIKAAKDQGSVLAIFNTISATKKVFEKVKEQIQDHVYILTTRMCPEHRKQAIQEIKDLLKDGEPVICVSTALIEAGVDISFSCVFRSLCGLDSIVQSAGRCNRNAEKEYGTVNLILMDQDTEKLNRLPEIKNGKEIVQGMLDDGYSADSFLEDETIKHYFQILYRDADTEYAVNDQGYQLSLADCIDGTQMMNRYLAERQAAPKTIEGSASETIARNFEVIDEDTISLIAPYGSGKEIIAELNSEAGFSQLKQLMKSAQPYLIGIYRSKVKELIDQGAILVLGDEYHQSQIFAIRDDFYDDKVGLVDEPVAKEFVSF